MKAQNWIDSDTPLTFLFDFKPARETAASALTDLRTVPELSTQLSSPDVTGGKRSPFQVR
jgi:hypothetical protein